MHALFIWGFALYGIFVVLWKIVRAWMHRVERNVPVTAVLVVTDGAAYIEGILRTLTTAEPFASRQLDVVVIDCGSRDETVRIVEAIAGKQGSVRLVRAAGEPYQALTEVLGGRGRAVHCIFDLRGKVSPLDVVPTLASFWHGRTA